MKPGQAILFPLIILGLSASTPTIIAAPPEQSADADEPKFVAASDVGYFELVVADAEGKPIPGAQVEVRSRPKPEWELLVGKFLRKARYGTFMRTDRQGRLRIKLPGAELSYLNCSIRAPGYGPFWAGWSFQEKTEVLPASYTAHLDAGQSVGGIVVDDQGQPVEGAKIHPSIEFKKRETDESQLGSGWSTKTDKEGRWRADCVPAALDRLSLSIVHPNFVPTMTVIATKKYRLQMDQTPHQTIILDRGVTLAGTVTDADGNPIKDAKVRAALMRDTREARTDAAGKYAIPGCPKTAMVVVTTTAKRFAPDQAEVDLRKDPQPLDFQLKPGNTIRVRVVDKDGKPENKARIFFRSWRKDNYGDGLDTVHQYTDENGVWEWKDAPEDAIIVDVCPVGKLQIGNQTLIAREEEYVFVSAQPLTIEGLVLDAESQEPLESFRVIPGLKWPGSTKPLWNRRDSFDGRGGKFHYIVNRMDATHLIRIEAPGYAPLVSRDVAVDEGNVKFQWKLKKAENIEIQVERPDGSPAVGADVAVGIEGAQLVIRNAQFSNTYAQRVKVDKAGVLKLNPEAESFLLVILDQAGYAIVACEPTGTPESIRLTAWATIEGSLQVGSAAGKDVNLVYLPTDSLSLEGFPHISWDYYTTTDDAGNFRFAKVLPGKGMLSRQIRSHDTGNGYRTQWSHNEHVRTKPGETLVLKLGGNGRAVIGQALASDDIKEPLDWGFAVIVAQPVIGDPPSIPYPPNLDEDGKAAWYQAWVQTPLGKQWQELSRQHAERQNQRPRYVTAIGRDGKFRIEDVPPGKYEVELPVERRPAQRFGRTSVIACWEGTFEIPKIDGQPDPLDLGELVVRPK